MYFNKDFDSNGLLFLFFMFQKKYLQFRLKKAFAMEHFTPYASDWMSQRYVHNLERNWKTFICISVKNFPNL